MLKGIIICENQELTHRLSRVLGTTEQISIRRKLSEYPDSIELLRVLRTQAPDVIFLSFESAGKALELGPEVAADAPLLLGESSARDLAAESRALELACIVPGNHGIHLATAKPRIPRENRVAAEALQDKGGHKPSLAGVSHCAA